MGYIENIENNFKKAKTEIENLKQNMSSLQSLSDIETSLSRKANSSDLSEVAFSGDYNDLANKPDNSDLLSIINNKADAFGVGYGLQNGFDTSNAWTAPISFGDTSTSYNWTGITYGNNKFVAIGDGGYISTSTDGITWTTPAKNSNLGNYNWKGITYGNNKFVAIGDGGYISTSTDGVTWTTPVKNSNLGSNAWTGIAYGNNKFVALGMGGYISTSTDGVTWTDAVYNPYISSFSWRDITYGNNKFVALGYNGYISTSTDGVTWTSATYNSNLGSNKWRGIAYGNNKFIALGYDGYTSTSTDGVTWTGAVKTNLGAIDWVNIIYGNNKFIALGLNSDVSIQTIYDSDYLCVTNTLFDGPWVADKTTLSSSNLAIGTYRLYDQISSYLPNDEYYYEVEIFLKYESKSTTVTTVSFNNGYNIENFFYGDAYGSSNQECKSMKGSIIIGPPRILNMIIENAKPAVLDVKALRYRRLGTNV